MFVAKNYLHDIIWYHTESKALVTSSFQLNTSLRSLCNQEHIENIFFLYLKFDDYLYKLEFKKKTFSLKPLTNTGHFDSCKHQKWLSYHILDVAKPWNHSTNKRNMVEKAKLDIVSEWRNESLTSIKLQRSWGFQNSKMREKYIYINIVRMMIHGPVCHNICCKCWRLSSL